MSRVRIPRVLWVVIYKGSGQAFPSMDMPATWNTKAEAQKAILRYKKCDGYSVHKFVRHP